MTKAMRAITAATIGALCACVGDGLPLLEDDPRARTGSDRAGFDRERALRDRARPPPPLDVAPDEPAAYLPDPEAALAKVNAYRDRFGYDPLRLNPDLSAVALAQVQVLAVRGEVSSQAPDGGSIMRRLAEAGLPASQAGSLVAGGYRDFDQAMTAWRRDQVQRSRLLLPRATDIGIALIEDPLSPYRYYVEAIILVP